MLEIPITYLKIKDELKKRKKLWDDKLWNGMKLEKILLRKLRVQY